MPLLAVDTNVPGDEAADKAFLAKASQGLAQLLGKPEQYVMVRLERHDSMCFAGTQDPLAYAELKSLGLPEERTKELSAGLCELLEDSLGVPPDRVYIEFSSPPRHLFGYNSTTF